MPDGALGLSPKYPVGVSSIKAKVPQTDLSGLDGWATRATLQGVGSHRLPLCMDGSHDASQIQLGHRLGVSPILRVDRRLEPRLLVAWLMVPPLFVFDGGDDAVLFRNLVYAVVGDVLGIKVVKITGVAVAILLLLVETAIEETTGPLPVGVGSEVVALLPARKPSKRAFCFA